MLMVNDRRLNTDTFWFTLFHEIGHIINSDLGINFDGKIVMQKMPLIFFAENILIPPDAYQQFIEKTIII